MPRPVAHPANPGPLDLALSVVGDRWTLLVIQQLLDGPKRFNELGVALTGIAPNILVARLRQLESGGLVVATPYSQRPLRLAYALAPAGSELAAVIAQLEAWGSAQGAAPSQQVHASCGTPLEIRQFCPTCDQVVDAEADDQPRWV